MGRCAGCGAVPPPMVPATVCPEHVTYIATIICIYAIGAIGQNLLIGYTGQISFGQAGFLAIGAYTFGHLARFGMPWPVTLLCAGTDRGSLRGYCRFSFSSAERALSGNCHYGIRHCCVPDLCQFRAALRRANGTHHPQADADTAACRRSASTIIST